MSKKRRVLSWLTAAVVVGIFCRLSLLTPTPSVFSPANMLTFLAYGIAESMVTAVAVMPIVFCLWSFPILMGRAEIPKRSLVLFLFAVVLSAVVHIGGFSCAIQYQDQPYAIGVSILNLVCAAEILSIAKAAQAKPSIARNLAFHCVLFSWLAWSAFPWMGELP
jgi:hypothetical protein